MPNENPKILAVSDVVDLLLRHPQGLRTAEVAYHLDLARSEDAGWLLSDAFMAGLVSRESVLVIGETSVFNTYRWAAIRPASSSAAEGVV